MIDLTRPGLAQTHALVIGVGAYMHLLGGRQQATRTYGLGQLGDSPSSSAAYFAHWVLENGSNLLPPLGSLDVLSCSPTFIGPDGVVRPTTPPDMAAIKLRFKSWLVRCSANADNLALFYYCGHGLQRRSLLLLPADFLADEDNLSEHAVNFDATFRALRTRPLRQIYFIDCCRDAPGATSTIEAEGSPLLHFDEKKPDVALSALYYAVGRGEQAHAPPEGGVSYFTRALIDCLKSRAAEFKDEDDRWIFSTTSLSAAIAARSIELDRPPWTSGGAVAHFQLLWKKHVDVPTFVTCRPPETPGTAHVRMFDEHGTLRGDGSAACREPITMTLDAGTYELRASFSGGYLPFTGSRIVQPPVHRCAITARV